MALTSLLLLMALASTAIAQDTVTPQPSTTTMMAMTSTPVPMQTPAPVVGNVSAEEVRRDHFFCLDLGEDNTRSRFLNTPTDDPYRWGLWIQYPVLSYLDTMRKRHLFFVISEMAARANVPNLFDNICVAEVEQYGVSTYRESVFVKLYIRDSMDYEATIRSVDEAFRSAYTPANSYTVDFLGRTAIDITTTSPPEGLILANKTVNDSVHPGCDMESCPEGDPTLLAIVLGTYVGRAYYGQGDPPEEVTVENLERGISADIGTFYRLNEFAENPRPINYGLEAGDIVFAVFGSIFLTILTGAIVLGYVIHPFFLS